jgi:L-aspartate oxidase
MEIQTDILVIGSGIAGLSLAIQAATLGSVAVVTKKEAIESNTNYAQGGVAAVVDPQDSFDAHVQDTITAGAGLCREDVVQFVVREGPGCIAELIRWGVAFTKSTECIEGEFYDLERKGAIRGDGSSMRRTSRVGRSNGPSMKRPVLRKTSRSSKTSSPST